MISYLASMKKYVVMMFAIILHIAGANEMIQWMNTCFDAAINYALLDLLACDPDRDTYSKSFQTLN